MTSKNSSLSSAPSGKRRRSRRGQQTKTAVESRSLRQPRGRKAESARQELEAALDEVMFPYCEAHEQLRKELDDVDSPANVAALMAPRDEKALLMQRMEDSNLRQLWRLTNMLVKVRNGALT